MRGVKVKRLAKMYNIWLKGVLPHVPEGMKPISFRVFRRRLKNV
jgi:hypothetical protein